MKKLIITCLSAGLWGAVLVGCAAPRQRITFSEQVPASALEPIKTKDAEAPVKIQVLDFVVTSTDINAANTDGEAAKRYFSLVVPRHIYKSLGSRGVFSVVSRSSQAQPTATDFIVSGEYEVVSRQDGSASALTSTLMSLTPELTSHSLYFKGTVHIHLTEAKAGSLFFEKTYIEEKTEKGRGNEPLNLSWLTPEFVEPITADIKNAIYLKLGKTP